MTPSETLLKAVLNRIKVRLDENVVLSVSEVSGFIKVAPSRIKKEWDLFKEEILEETDRINKKENEECNVKKNSFQNDAPEILQNKIYAIRKNISKLTNQIEEIN